MYSLPCLINLSFSHLHDPFKYEQLVASALEESESEIRMGQW